MSDLNAAARAYAAATDQRATREREADVFRTAMARLQAARRSGDLDRVRALADNRRLWLTVTDMVRDPSNGLPPETRAGILSIGLTVQKEMEAAEPNIDFLITINRHMADGLSGNP